MILVEKGLQEYLGILLDLGFAGRQRLVDLALTDHFPHGGLSSFSDRLIDLCDVKEIVRRFFNLVLHDEFDGQDIHVAGEHQGFLRQHLLAALPICAEAYLDTMEFLDFRLQDGFDKGDFSVRARSYGSDRDAELLDDAFLIRGDDKDTLPGKKDEQPC